MAKFCTYCGSELEDNKNFCSNCGASLKEKKENQTKSNAQSEKKSKVGAGVMGILLGFLGVHNFYLGFTGKAIAQLLISVCSCFVLSWVSAIWGLIEGIMILTGSINTDAKGNELED